MKNRDVLILFIILLILTCHKAFSKERYEFYNGVRQLGMGGVAVATVNDETSLMLNPAALGKLRNEFFTLADPELEVGDSVYDYFVDNDYDYSELLSPQDILNNLISATDQHYHLKAQVSPSFVVPNFGIGVLGTWNYDAEVLSATDEFEIRYRNDYAAMMGYNLRLFDGRIKIGVTGRYVTRAEVDEKLPTSSTNLEFKDLVNEGTGVAADIGMILTGPWTYLPSLAAVVRDAGNTSYTLGSGFMYDSRPTPDTTKQTLDVGFSVTPILGKYVRVQIAGEYRDVMDAYETDSNAIRKTHAGMEFNFYDHFFLRAGYNQGYWAAGFEVAFQFIQIQAASSGEEIGTADDPREDRRYVFKFAFRF